MGILPSMGGDCPFLFKQCHFSGGRRFLERCRKSDGTVISWGYNFRRQTNVPAGLKNVLAVAAGDYHYLALKNDGTVVAWGWNEHGQATVPSDLSAVSAI